MHKSLSVAPYKVAAMISLKVVKKITLSLHFNESKWYSI